MSHSFVLAKLSPQLSSSRLPLPGPHATALLSGLTTQPFVALVLNASDVGSQLGYGRVLFLVSPKKPQGENCKFFAVLPLDSKGDRTLHITMVDSQDGPPSPAGALYIYTIPPLYEQQHEEQPEESVMPSNSLPYHLDEPSFEVFRSLVSTHKEKWFRDISELQRTTRESGGDESVQDDWETWSGDVLSNLGALQTRLNGFRFEYLNADAVDLFSLQPPSILEDLKIFTKLAEDYSWDGVSNAVSWTLESRQCSATVDVPRDISLVSRSSRLYDETREHVIALHNMRIPLDGDPGPANSADGDDFDGAVDEEIQHVQGDAVPDPLFQCGCWKPPVPGSGIKVVVFDMIGSIFDRQTPVERVLRVFGFPEINKMNEQDLLKTYFEYESLAHQNNPKWTLAQIIDRALEDTFLHFSIPIRLDPVQLQNAREGILQLTLYPDAEATIQTLSSRSITVVGLSVPDAASFALPPIPSDLTFDSTARTTPALFLPSPELFASLFERLQLLRSDLQNKEEVLVITTGRYRTVEPAHNAGYPTALIQHNLESRVDLLPYSCPPTLVVRDGLKALVEKLQLNAELPPEGGNPFNATLTIRASLYQGEDVIGKGSFGEVWAGFHVLTGNEVAIKHDADTDEYDYVEQSHDCETDPCIMAYEAQVYKLLRGEPGFPSLRWYGKVGKAHVLIAEKLGPDLEAILRLCRGRFSLKTVLMLGLQMLERVEFFHSHGLILRDIKSNNFLMGLGDRSSMVYLLDFGLVKPYMDPITGEHIKFREDRVPTGTLRFVSYNVHFEREPSRRDDIEALGNVLLYLLHGRLPWQGIYGPSVEAKIRRIGEMKSGKAMQDLIDRSPGTELWNAFFSHCRGLQFEDKPDYDFLRSIMLKKLKENGGAVDWRFDWLDGTSLEKGTLVPEEYKLDAAYYKGGLLGLIPNVFRYGY